MNAARVAATQPRGGVASARWCVQAFRLLRQRCHGHEKWPLVGLCRIAHPLSTSAHCHFTFLFCLRLTGRAHEDTGQANLTERTSIFSSPGSCYISGPELHPPNIRMPLFTSWPLGLVRNNRGRWSVAAGSHPCDAAKPHSPHEDHFCLRRPLFSASAVSANYW